MVSLSISNTISTQDGIRPVNLRTDLAPLADLIELAFSDTMDNNGRAAVREMRTLSRMRPVLHTLLGVNELVQGISLGYVWVEGGRLVGNVSLYPADIPRKLGKTWIIANVAVHPDYRGRGIARQLMRVSMDAIRKRGVAAILQVDADNAIAEGLYSRLGFRRERAWSHWRRSSTLRIPPPITNPMFRINRRRDEEWRSEQTLAASVRPDVMGGIGWQRPLHEGLFRPSWLKSVNDALNFRSIERLVVRSADERDLYGVLWVESAFASSSTQLTLMVDPEYAGVCDEALLNLAIRRFGNRSPLTLEHPADDEITRLLLIRYGFQLQRTLVHMRWDVGA
ncbi:MAG: GNAT family N-acetyltransferase [Chloroflexota bacterium]|nr:GNAT family N-acetyltransferase [Chloroflexota bacterium]